MKEGESAIEALRHIDEKVMRLSQIQAMLEWDLETEMPEAAVEERSEQLSLISQIINEISSSYEAEEALGFAENEAKSDEDKALVRIWDRKFYYSSRVPSSLEAEISSARSFAHRAWLKAREEDDWSIFRPSLERLVSLSIEKAKLMEGNKDPYDTMLDQYEKGASAEILDPAFKMVGEAIQDLVLEVSEMQVDDSFLSRSYDTERMKAFCREVVTEMGFDWKRGRVGVSAHPFTTTLGSDDVGITNRFNEGNLFAPISTAIHECGHALYCQHASLPASLRGTSVGEGASMGVHESQSRFWENMIGRSHDFWEGMYPVLLKYIPELSDVSLDAFVQGINAVRPSPIRVDADELTYNLHIILRYEMEKAMINGSVSFGELPAMWNELSKKILFYTPENDREGILQDCHWAGGDFGYFPSYALGNIYASEFYETMKRDVGEDKLSEALRSRSYSVITEWQNEKIWSQGAIYEPVDLVWKVNGKGLDVVSFIKYLEAKYRGLFL